MATRSKRFITGVLTGYGTIASNIIFTMTSIPLALHYLDKEQFGLWALALQVNGYLSIIDLGMSGAVSRFIADFKDNVNGGAYGSHLLTGAIVFLIQGLLIAVTGFAFSWFAPSLFDIPAHLATDFRHLLLFLCSISAIAVSLRSLVSPLWCFQRNDVINGCASIGLFVTLGMLWFGFRNGWGVMSFAYAQFPGLLGTLAVQTFVCRRNRYYPSRKHWGRPSLAVFRRMFHFGKDNLMISFGSQLINATQIMIISRWVGLEAAATFSVATKFYNLAMQLALNPISASSAGLTELYVRGENNRFVRRYWDLVALTLALSVIAATGLAAGNRALIAVWTDGAIHWTWAGDLLLGLLIVLRNFNGCFVGMFGLIKNWKPVRYVYLAEGLVFVPAAILLANYFGLMGVLIASLVVHLGISTTLAARQAIKVLGPWVSATRSLGTALGLIGLASLFAWAAVGAALSPYTVLVSTALILLLTTVPIWFLIMPLHMRSELASRANAARTGILRKLFLLS
jgi:O-antigen/teichoic acid export membrane protein